VATVIEIESGRRGYVELVNLVQRRGHFRMPRGLRTYDLGHVDVVVKSPYDALPLGVGRALLPAIGAAEACQLVAGRARHDLLPRIAPLFSKFAEPGTGKFHGAYGDRIGSQVAAVVRKINADRETRQAVVTLWDPARDNLPERRDYPCTVALNFAVVHHKLELRTLMRSNDVWLGWPYDVFQFTQLQLTVARALQIEPGTYTHSAWSLHIYHEHGELVDGLRAPELDDVGPFQPVGFGADDDDWLMCHTRAANILQSYASPREETESERWYRDQLKPYA